MITKQKCLTVQTLQDWESELPAVLQHLYAERDTWQGSRVSLRLNRHSVALYYWGFLFLKRGGTERTYFSCCKMATSSKMATTHRVPTMSKATAGKCDSVKRDTHADIIHHTSIHGQPVWQRSLYLWTGCGQTQSHQSLQRLYQRASCSGLGPHTPHLFEVHTEFDRCFSQGQPVVRRWIQLSSNTGMTTVPLPKCWCFLSQKSLVPTPCHCSTSTFRYWISYCSRNHPVSTSADSGGFQLSMMLE